MAHFEQASVCEKMQAKDGSVELRLTESYESAIRQCLKRDGPARDYHQDLHEWAQDGVNAIVNARRGTRYHRCVLCSLRTALHLFCSARSHLPTL